MDANVAGHLGPPVVSGYMLQGLEVTCMTSNVCICKGNLTILRRIIHLDLAKGKYINDGRYNIQHLPSQGESKENALRIPG
jgi:hypothetical protein